MSTKTRDKTRVRQAAAEASLRVDGVNSRAALYYGETEVLRYDGTSMSPQVSSTPAATADLGSSAAPYRNAYLSGLLNESAADALTAAGTTQAGALALTKEVNRFTTVGASSGARLPASAAGLTIVVINSGANPLQVYGASTDIINDVATATGVTQMPGSVVIYACTVAGKWYTEGLATGFTGSLATMSFADALTAVGTTQATGLQLAAMINRITVGASTTGVNLPASAPGLAVTVINAVANSIHVYPVIGGSETINGAAAATGIIIGPNTALTFLCTVAGTWVTGTPVMPQIQYQTASNTTGFTATGPQIAGDNENILNLTGALGAGANIQLPTVAAMVAAMHNVYVGQSFKLRIINLSSGAFSWTVTTNTGWTLNGTMTIGQNFSKDFVVTLTSLSAATIQSIGQVAQSAV